MSFVAEFLDMMPDTLAVQPGVRDGFGKFIASGSASNYSCRIEGRHRMTRDMSGRETLSTVQVIVGDAPGLTTDLHRYTLPARFRPNADLAAIAVEMVADESGPCYETVYLP